MSVREGRVVLRSRRLGTEVRPRITSAHNPQHRSLGIYRFLCALQGEGRIEGVMWSWGPLESQRRLPRVRYGRVILARAQWNLPKSEVEALRAQEGAAWLHTLRGRDYGILREMFPDLRSDIVSAPEGRFVNEIVVPVLRKSGPAVRGATGPRCSPPCTRIALRPFPTPTDPAIGAPLVRQSGGRLDAESQGFGRGATFSLYLPAAQRR